MDESKVVDMVAALKGKEKPRAPVERRTGWTGLSPEEAQRPGAELLAALYQKANEDGLNLREMALALGVTYGYIHQLKGGVRGINQVGDDFIDRCAQYLRKPKAYVRALAGKQTFLDDYTEASIDGELDTALAVMQKDPKWGGNMPLSLKNLDRRERLFVVKLYEAATGKVLLPDVSIDAS